MWSFPAVPTIVPCLPAQVAADAWPVVAASSSAHAARTPAGRLRAIGYGMRMGLPPFIGAKRRGLQFSNTRPGPGSRLGTRGRVRSLRMRGGTYVLNFYSAVFVDQLKRGRKTATIRLGDKSNKYERGQVVWITVGFRPSPRQKIFAAVIDEVEVKKVSELSRRDIEHDNPEFRR